MVQASIVTRQPAARAELPRPAGYKEGPVIYLGIQLDGVLSTSHVANSFMGTGLMPSPKMVCFSAMTVVSGAQHKGVWDACLGASTHVVGASLTRRAPSSQVTLAHRATYEVACKQGHENTTSLYFHC